MTIKIWDLPAGIALVGTERIPCDTSGGGTAADTPYLTSAQMSTYVSGALSPAITAAQSTATDALYPLVQTAHTTATRLLAASDAGAIIPMDGTSNAIEVTIPVALWQAGGTGRATVLQIKVISVAGGALTFVGSGGIVVSYSGKDPGVDAYIAGDYLTVVVDSATTARVFATEVL